MESTIFFKTKNNNSYLFDKTYNYLLNIHPIIRFFYTSEREGLNIEDLLNNKKTSTINIEPIGEFSKEEIDYQFNKYNFLKKNNFFSEVNQRELLQGKIDADTVSYNLANLKNVAFEVTDGCNLNCLYCRYGNFYSDYDKRENKNIDINNSKLLLTYLAKIWNSSDNNSFNKEIIIGFYGGEPLLNISFIKEIVSFAKQLKLKNNFLSFSMTTNALLLDRYMDFLAENKFQLLISLDGNKKNNSYRVYKNKKPSFNKLIDNLKLLRDKYPEYFEKYININAVLHNKNSVSEIYNFIKTEFDKIPSILSVVNHGINENNSDVFFNTYRNKSASLYEAEDYAAIDRDLHINFPDFIDLSKTIQAYSGFIFEDYKYLLTNDSNCEIIPTSTCSPFSLRLFLTVNNKIITCEKIAHHFAMGKIEDGNVVLNYEEIAEQYNMYIEKVKKQCNLCYNYSFCGQCMFLLENLDNEPNCKGFQNLNDFEGFFSSRILFLEENPNDYLKIMEEN